MSKRRTNKRKRKPQSPSRRTLPSMDPADSIFRYTDSELTYEEATAYFEKGPPPGLAHEYHPIQLTKRPTLTTADVLRLTKNISKGYLAPTMRDIGRLDPTNVHRVHSAFQHLDVPMVRVILDTACRDGKRRYTTIDMRLRHFGMLIDQPLQVVTSDPRGSRDKTKDANRLLQEVRATIPEDDTIKLPAGMKMSQRLGILRPEWEMAQSFNRVWEHCEKLLNQVIEFGDITPEELKQLNAPIMAEHEGVHSAFHYHSAQYLAQLQQAHLIKVDPEQVMVLPPFQSGEEVMRYIRQAKLPFDCVYFDMEGQGGLCPLLRKTQGDDPDALDFPMRGALVWTEGESLVICPVGDYKSGSKPKHFTEYVPLAQIRLSTAEPTQHLTWIEREFDGHTVTIARLGIQKMLDFVRERWPASDEGVDIPDPAAETHEPVGILDLTWPAFLLQQNPNTEKPSATIHGLTAWLMAMKVLELMFFMETPNIELVEGGGRVERRRADRTGAQIATIIRVHHNTKRYVYDKSGDSEPANYSHQFEVMGHYKHFPVGTRAADARPDLVRPCPRPDHTHCRRIWCPTFVKGDENLPFIPKTRLYKPDDQDEREAS